MNDNPGVLPRFYAPDLDVQRGRARLVGEEAHHVARVLRLRAGDEVAVFDGRGTEFRARVDVVDRDVVSLALVSAIEPAAGSRVELVVVQSVLKGSSMDAAIRDSTMMGVSTIVPVLTAHTDVKVAVATRPATLERWRRLALSAVKQSRRATLPAIDVPRTFDDWLTTESVDMELLFIEPSASVATRVPRSLLDRAAPSRATVLLGPEGGWAREEIEAALNRGCIPLTLGPLTLRAESMPIAALAALAAIWE